MTRIAIDARVAAEERGGRGVLVRELLRALAALDSDHEYRLLARERWEELDERFAWDLIPGGEPVWHLRAARHADRASDVFYSTNSYLTAWFTRVPTVLTMHDMIAFRPELEPRRRAALIERATLRRAVNRCAGIVAISEAAAGDLVARYPQAAPKTRAAPLAADARFAATDGPAVDEVCARHGLDAPYVLGVGTLEPRKNLPRLIEAFAALGDDVRGAHRLALVGAKGWATGETEGAITRHGDLVRAIGHVPDADLPALYRGATLFAYPSIYEGFGLPVLEAMTAGTAVVTSEVSSLPEVAGDAALYADPHDVASIRDALARGLGDAALREQLAARGRDRARLFSWRRHAETVLEVLQSARR